MLLPLVLSTVPRALRPLVTAYNCDEITLRDNFFARKSYLSPINEYLWAYNRGKSPTRVPVLLARGVTQDCKMFGKIRPLSRIIPNCRYFGANRQASSFKVLGIQQVAIGGLDKQALSAFLG